MGDLAKVVLRYDTAFWPRDQYVYGYLCRPVQDRPTMVVSMTKTHDIPALVLQAGGNLARDIETMPMAECEAWALSVVRDIFGASVPAPRSVERTQWSVDPLSRGSYSYVAVGSNTEDIAALADPVNDVLYFAGEAAYRHHWAGAHGAYASGVRATLSNQSMRELMLVGGSAFLTGVLLFNVALWRTRVAPRWIAGFGLLVTAFQAGYIAVILSSLLPGGRMLIPVIWGSDLAATWRLSAGAVVHPRGHFPNARSCPQLQG